jgi:thiol:disulfide interchange protein DsbC
VKKTLSSFVLSAITTLVLVSWCLAAEDEAAVREMLLKTYPHISVGEIHGTDIPGLYELEMGPNVVYFYPDKNLMVFGEIWTKEGKSVTATRREQLAAKRVKDIPLDKGIRIGNGKTTIIEFTDPDCSYCRKAFEYLKGRNDTTRYVYFFPMPAHKDAENKARFILCSSDKAKAYEEVMSGKYDDRKVATCKDDGVAALMKKHKELASKAGVNGTPTFWINGHVVVGANIPAIESILKNQKNLN